MIDWKCFLCPNVIFLQKLSMTGTTTWYILLLFVVAELACVSHLFWVFFSISCHSQKSVPLHPPRFIQRYLEAITSLNLAFIDHLKVQLLNIFYLPNFNYVDKFTDCFCSLPNFVRLISKRLFLNSEHSTMKPHVSKASSR